MAINKTALLNFWPTKGVDAGYASYIPIVGGAVDSVVNPHDYREPGVSFRESVAGQLGGTLGASLGAAGGLFAGSPVLGGILGSSIGTHLASQANRSAVPFNAKTHAIFEQNQERKKPKQTSPAAKAPDALTAEQLKALLDAYHEKLNLIKNTEAPDPAKAPDADKIELHRKTASVLRNLAVKRASELVVDAFITKVAAALPITKRAAFRTMQAQLATGDSLPDAIKVAFPKLDATQRHKLAISICKCAIDDANKMTQRSPESYTVPAKDAAKTMREKCSRLGGDGRDEKPLLGQTEKPVLKDPPEARQRMLGDKMESAVSPFLLNYKEHPDLARSAPVSESLPTSAPSPTNAFGFNYMDYLKNPYVLGGLTLGAGGLGAYGLYNLMKKRRRRPVEELD